MEAKFMISEVMSTSWKCLKSQIWVLAGLLIGVSILSLTLSILSAPMQHSLSGKSIVVLISLIILLIFYLGYIKNMFQTLDGIEPQFSAYGQQARKIFTCLIASLIMTCLIAIGTCLFIIPGIYLGLRLQFFTIFIVEEDAGIIESLKRSWEITQGQTMSLFMLALVMMLVAMLGLILFIVGIYIAFPLIYMMQCYVFRKLNTLLQA